MSFHLNSSCPAIAVRKEGVLCTPMCRASTSLLTEKVRKVWMAGTSPAMTKRKAISDDAHAHGHGRDDGGREGDRYARRRGPATSRKYGHRRAAPEYRCHKAVTAPAPSPLHRRRREPPGRCRGRARDPACRAAG